MTATSIEWTDETWNPTLGCSRVSPGCDNCYAIGVAHRGLTAAHRGLTIRRPGERADWTGEVRTLPERLVTPLTWKQPRRVFVDSMSDLFHKAIPDPFVAEVFAVMAVARRHTFQVLTKRPQRMSQLLADGYVQRQVPGYVDHVVSPSGQAGSGWLVDYRTWREAMASLAHRWAIDRTDAGHLSDRLAAGWTPPNIWLGTSIENDRQSYRADHLRATPAALRFLSLEPLLGPLPSLNLEGIDWVIAGGESGPSARPLNPEDVRDIRDRCVDAGIPFLFKQWGTWLPYEDDPQPPFLLGQDGEFIDGHVLPADLTDHHPTSRDGVTWWWPEPDDVIYRRGPKHRRLLDGRTWDEMPRG